MHGIRLQKGGKGILVIPDLLFAEGQKKGSSGRHLGGKGAGAERGKFTKKKRRNGGSKIHSIPLRTWPNSRQRVRPGLIQERDYTYGGRSRQRLVK